MVANTPISNVQQNTTTVSTAIDDTTATATTTTTADTATATINNSNINNTYKRNNKYIKSYLPTWEEYKSFVLYIVYALICIICGGIYGYKFYKSESFLLLGWWIVVAKTCVGIIYINTFIVFIPVCHGLITRLQVGLSSCIYIHFFFQIVIYLYILYSPTDMENYTKIVATKRGI